MAGESILVVDDAPVNLKLADILLRKEGYKVHAVPMPKKRFAYCALLFPK